MRWLEQHWYRISPLHLVLWPLSVLFTALAALRRLLYLTGVLAVTRMPVPVIVVGNISVGGTGKTPLVIWLAQLLRERGYHPGVVCRGYGGSARGPQRATIDSNPSVVGDEAALLARRCACPVWVRCRTCPARDASRMQCGHQ
jgi:tetraacyldisaccharide 4'-kinase